MADGEQRPEGEQNLEGSEEKMITMPERVLRDYTKQMNDALKRNKEEQDEEIRKLREEIKEYQRRPLSGWAQDLGEETRAAIVEKMKSGAMDREIEVVAAPIVAKKTVELYNKVDGTHAESVEEVITGKLAHKKKIRRRNRLLVAAVGLVTIATLGLAGWSAYTSNKTNVESAAGTANRAMATAKEAKSESASLRRESDAWKIEYGTQKKKEDEARKAEISGLETRLTGKIAEKADKTELTTQIADVKKNYATLDATLKAELAKNNAREEAYTEFKKLADATKTSLDELAKNYDAFSKKATSREEINAELAKINKSISDAEANIKKYGELITQMQTESGGNMRAYAELSKDYGNVAERVKKIEEELRKYAERQKENSDNQPPLRDR